MAKGLIAPRTSGIYAIYSAINETTYIGSAVNIRKRWERHKSELRGGYHENEHLQRAWLKYGEYAFEFYVIEECIVELLIAREQHHLDLHPAHYNMCPIAGSTLGYKHTPESKANMSASKMGNTNLLGHIHSSETIEKMKGNKNAAGSVRSPETLERMSAAQMGKKHTPEARAKMSAARIGHEVTHEAREKIGQASRGRKHTAEAKAKISAARKAYWERKRIEDVSDG